MSINYMRVNHLENPLGYKMEHPVFSWCVQDVKGQKQEAARILVSKQRDISTVLFDSGNRGDISSLGYEADIKLEPCTRYYWNVQVDTDAGERLRSETAWFETAKREEEWTAKWIGSSLDEHISPLFFYKFHLEEVVSSARAYVTGLGLFELEMNGKKVGDEYLTPGCNDVGNWVQYVTFDVTEHLQIGDNAVAAFLGNGWYKEWFGYSRHTKEFFDTPFLFLLELQITLKSGEKVVIGTNKDWRCNQSAIMESTIYNGEVYDANQEIEGYSTIDCDTTEFQPAVEVKAPIGALVERLNVPVRKIEEIKPVAILHTPSGELVVDFGQEITGWVTFTNRMKKGESMVLQFGEWLLDGNFYRENLGEAKAEYCYISSGKVTTVRPHFTFYGFRYMKINAQAEVENYDFTGWVLHSDIDITGTLTTSNEKVNRLFLNTLWGQRDNFLDVPTDCPQRNERLGWTGDAQVFCATASYNMYTPAFFNKYLYDMLLEQRDRGGAVPHVVPDTLEHRTRIDGNMEADHYSSSAWGDAGTIIPWTMYLFYGDTTLLKQHYENMRLWLTFVQDKLERECGGSRLWTSGFHFGDWLALDNPGRDKRFGRTDNEFVATAYYYYSATLTAKAARVLGYDEDAVTYEGLAKEIKQALQEEFFSFNGRLAVDTQTAYVLALHFDFVPKEYRTRIIADFKQKLERNEKHLDTGFVGTAYLCNTLSEVGLSEYAYSILLNEDFPSWLYEVNMGATTIWERWNSVMPDGSMNPDGMNSLNHYAYGAVSEWMYRHMAGINPVEEKPGFKRVVICPKVDERFSFVKATFKSAAGYYESGWKREADAIHYLVTVPFDASASFCLVKIPNQHVTVNGKIKQELIKTGKCELLAGTYEIVVEGK